MADSDVDEILHKFFSTIAEKDADAFKLYEDNKRMRDLVQQTLQAREELEAQHRTTLLLVTSLQAALQEKERLIAAQDDENASWRDGIAELRAILDRPSEMDAGLADVVEDVRHMTAELRSLRRGFRYAQWCCDGWEAYAMEGVLAAEARERATLEHSAAVSVAALHSVAVDATTARLRAQREGEATLSTVQRWQSWFTQVEGERDELVSAHERALQLADEAAQQQQARVEALQGELTALTASTRATEREARMRQERLAVEHENFARRVGIFEERCLAAERAAASSVRELRLVVVELDGCRKDKQQALAQLEALQQTHEQSRVRLSRLSKQVEQLKQQASEMEDLQQRYTDQQDDLRLLRDKYLAVSEKERGLRQQLHSAAETSAAKLKAAEEALTTCQRQCSSTEEKLRISQDELRNTHKEMAALRRQAEEHRATEAVLQATQEQLRETEKHAYNFRDALEVLKEEGQSQLQAVEQRHAETVAQLTRTHEEERRSAVQAAITQAEKLEAALQQAGEQHAHEKAALQGELQAWVAEVEALKGQLRSQEERLTAERAARRLLETQQQHETSVVRGMLEQSREEAQRVPLVAELELQLSAVSQRSRLMEEACRRSAGVIAQLREALQREQMVSRGLRQRDANAGTRLK